jgi:trans-aconitate methyltransferase
MTQPVRADSSQQRVRDRGRPRVPVSFFEDLYERSTDPWSFTTSDYERRKYAHTLSSLGAPRFDRALEIGCSIGVFTELLATVTGELAAIDVSERALARARRRLHDRRDVRFANASFPEQMPAGPWDLVVCSEILYYLDREAFALAVDRLRGCLEAGATVLAVHWRAATKTYPLLGDEVHDGLVGALGEWHALDDRRPQYRLDRFEGR